MSVTRIRAAIGLLVALGLIGCNAEMRTALEESGEELKTLRREAMHLRAQLGTVERRAKTLAAKANLSETAMVQTMVALRKAGVNVTSRGAAVVVTVATRILFESGMTDLQPAAQQELIDIATILNERFSNRPIAVEGHTDVAPPKRTADSFPTNWELSSARALAVLRCLVEDGGVKPERISAVAYGDTRPVADNGSDDGRAANRRVDIVVLPVIGTTQVSATFE